MRDYAKIARQYEKDVLSGKIVSCKWICLAVKREIKDRETAKPKTSKYFYDVDAGSRVCKFVEMMPHVKGQWAGRCELLKLEPWQCWVIMTLFSWKRRSDGMRRFREAYIRVARKNGKSALAAAIMAYCLLADGEFGAECYSGATTLRQAREVFDAAKRMISSLPKLLKAFNIEVYTKAISVERTNSKCEPLVGKPGDGSNPHLCVVDEVHEHDDSNLIDAMITGMGARAQPLMIYITTAGFNLAGPCYAIDGAAQRMLQDVDSNEQQFAAIFTIDEEDDWRDINALKKANPNLGVSVYEEFLERALKRAIDDPSEQVRFKTKHANQWVSQRAVWIPLELWQQYADPSITEGVVRAMPDVKVWFAIDLGQVSDMCAFVRLYSRTIEGKRHFYLFGDYYLPSETVTNTGGANRGAYSTWATQDILTVTEGAVTDHDLVIDDVLEHSRVIRPEEVVFDPYNALQSINRVADAGLTAVQFTQSPQNFGPPMDYLHAALRDGVLHHDGNPILTWMLANTGIRPVKKGLFAPCKVRPEQKIDGVVASIMAFARATAIPDDSVPILPVGYEMSVV